MKAPLLAAAAVLFVASAHAATVVPVVEVFGHNESSNYTGTITDMINGSGMNGYGVDGSPTWPTGEGHPSTWTLSSTSNPQQLNPTYGGEWQSQDILDGEAGDDVATNGKIGWTVLDLGSVTANLDEFYLWHIRENSGRVATDFNIYLSSSPNVAVAHGRTNGTSADYDFSSGGWTSIYTGQSGTQSGLQVFDLNGASARYIGIEIIDNGGDATRVGFQEVAVTAVPEPVVALLGGLGFLGLLRRRR